MKGLDEGSWGLGVEWNSAWECDDGERIEKIILRHLTSVK